MAKFRILDYIDIATHGYHDATSWQIAKDEEFNIIIDQSMNDSVNLMEWTSMLPKEDGSGYYADLDQIFFRCKIYIDNNESEWFTIKNDKKYEQDFLITQEGMPDYIFTIEEQKYLQEGGL